MQKYTVKPIALQDGIITDAFWGRYICKVSGTILPYQWELMNDHIENCEKSGCIQNFKIAAGEAMAILLECLFKIPIWQNGWKRQPFLLLYSSMKN